MKIPWSLQQNVTFTIANANRDHCLVNKSNYDTALICLVIENPVVNMSYRQTNQIKFWINCIYLNHGGTDKEDKILKWESRNDDDVILWDHKVEHRCNGWHTKDEWDEEWCPPPEVGLENKGYQYLQAKQNIKVHVIK